MTERSTWRATARAGCVAAAVLWMGVGAIWAMGAATPPPGPVALPEEGRRAPARGIAPASPPPDPLTQASAGLALTDAAEVTPDDLRYRARPVIVFADTPEDASFSAQMALLARDPATLAARDVQVIVDTDPASGSAWRTILRPRGFSLVVLDKQGMVIERRPTPWDTREIGRAIDKTPERRAEVARGGR